MTRAFVSIGSNVEPERHVALALAALRARFGAIEVSPVYRTAAVGFEGDDFLNLVVGFESDLDIEAVDHALDDIEAASGRTRGEPRFAPRTLDLDLLLFGDRVIDREDLRVPRRELLKYAFMLKPLADLAPALRHPVAGRSIAELLQSRDFSDQRCERADFDADSFAGA